MKNEPDNWWQHIAKTKPKPDKRLPILPFKAKPLTDDEPTVTGIHFEESEGTDGSTTIIQKVKKFRGI
jgi:hypothetical protein